MAMRIAIVNDLRLAVEALRRVVASRPDTRVAWVAYDGAEAVRRCAEDRPDMILMDLIMPGMNGAEATRRIMRDTPCPILVVTATVDGNIGLVFEAMGFGALDAVNTPVLGPDGSLAGARDLLRKIEILSHLVRPGPGVPAAGGPRPTAGSGPAARPRPAPGGAPPLVLLGASTGGPAALATILAALPGDLHAGLVVVQHIDQEFAPDLAVWLGRHCALRVRVAPAGCRPEAGTVWLAATNDHLVMRPGGALAYDAEPAACVYRPSVDVCFASAAEHWPAPGAAVLLTGMGRDGGAGLLALRRAGWATIAQDEATSVVYGMPRAAVELQAAARILPVSAIAAEILRNLGAHANAVR